MSPLSKRTSLVLALAAAAACWLGGRALNQGAVEQRATWPVGEEHVWLPPPEAARLLSVGYRQLWADINWARVLVYSGSYRSEQEDFQFRYLTRYLDNILALDPRFERVYEWAAYALLFQGGRKAEQEEYRMSLKYIERALQQYPDTYLYYWLAGNRYYIDIHPEDPAEKRRYRERGAELIEQAMRKPDAPSDLAAVAAGLRTELGQHERALANLREVIATTDDPEAQAQLLKAYRQLAGREFPDQITRAKEAFERQWYRSLPFAPPDMYVLLGERPSPVIDLDRLAAGRDLFGTDLNLDDAANTDRP